jgi:hypothetical protein
MQPIGISISVRTPVQMRSSFTRHIDGQDVSSGSAAGGDVLAAQRDEYLFNMLVILVGADGMCQWVVHSMPYTRATCIRYPLSSIALLSPAQCLCLLALPLLKRGMHL